MMTYSALAIANSFIELAKQKKRESELTHLKLQKLVYFAHAWNLAIKDEPLVDEQPEAWDYGPVFSSVYHEFKSFGKKPISRPGTIPVPCGEGPFFDFEFVSPFIKNDDIETQSLLEKIWDVYSKFSASQLSELTHKKDSPWDTTRSQSGSAISNDLIKEYMQQKVKAQNV